MFISVHMYMWVKWNENPMHFMGKERHNLANLNDGKLPQFHTKYVASKVTVTMCKMAIRSCSSHQLITIHMWALHWSHHERNYNIAFFFWKYIPLNVYYMIIISVGLWPSRDILRDRPFHLSGEGGPAPDAKGWPLKFFTFEKNYH